MASRRIFSTRLAAITIAIGLLVVGLAFSLALFEQPKFNDEDDRLWDSIGWLRPTWIRSVDYDKNTGHIIIQVEYVGNTTVTLNDVYVNETLDSEARIVPRVLSHRQIAEITLSRLYFPEPLQIAIRITTSDSKDASIVERFFDIQLERVDWDNGTGRLSAIVKNTGHERVTLNAVYVNGTLDGAAIPNPMVLAAGQTIKVALSGTYWDTNTDIPIRVTTLEGVAAEVSSAIHEIWIQSINWNRDTGEIGAYVYSRGYGIEVTVASVYVNGTLDAEAIIRSNTMATKRTPSDLWSITLSKTYMENPEQLTLKVVTADGAFDELTKRPNAYP